MTALHPAGDPAPVLGPLGIVQAGAHLARLGFLIINGTEPWAPGGAQLLVALRDMPTLEHFDPESVQHWVLRGSHGGIDEITRSTTVPLRRSFSWGSIRVTDRLEVYNSFLTFGGEVEVDRLDDHTTVCILRSPAPITRSTGHSQPADPLTGALGSFFARMKIPLVNEPELEARVGALTPAELYTAFLYVKDRRRERAHRADPDMVDDAVTRWLLAEKRRVSAADPAAWARATANVATLGIDAA